MPTAVSAAAAVVMVLLCAIQAQSAQADLTIPAQASVALNGGSIDLGCTSAIVAGSVSLDGGVLGNASDVTIAPGGSVDAGSGTVVLAGTWTREGAFVAGTSTVAFVDAPCATAGRILGATTFNALSITSSSGKRYALASGEVQSVNAALTIRGTPALPVQIVATQPPAQGYFRLAAGGAQFIANVGVSDNWAIGQTLAEGQLNAGGNANVQGWFGASSPLADVTPIPALDARGLLLTIAALLALTGSLRRRIFPPPKAPRDRP